MFVTQFHWIPQRCWILSTFSITYVYASLLNRKKFVMSKSLIYRYILIDKHSHNVDVIIAGSLVFFLIRTEGY